MQTVAETEAAIAKQPHRQQWEIAQWLEETLLSNETSVILAAIDEGIRSLETHLPLPLEDVRRKIKEWATTNMS